MGDLTLADRFREAITNGDEGTALDCLDRGLDSNATADDWSGWSLLQFVLNNSKLNLQKTNKFFDMLLEHGADINKKDYHESTPLIDAALRGNIYAVTKLIERGAKVNACDQIGRSALYQSCFRLCNVHSADDVSRAMECAMLLIGKGADINAKDKKGWTPLHWAAQQWNNVPLAQVLLEAGADTNVQNKEGKTPLYYACREANVEVIKELLSHGADPNILANHHESPLLVLRTSNISSKDCATIAKIMLESGANPNLANNNGLTPLHIFCGKGYTNAAKQCLLHGADVNAKDINGATPMKYMFEKSYSNTISVPTLKLLLKYKADLNIKDSEQELTPLMNMGRLGPGTEQLSSIEEITKLLVDAGADINIRNERGETALYIAAFNGARRISQAFLECGADPNIPDNEGRKAAQVARNGIEQIIEEFVKNKCCKDVIKAIDAEISDKNNYEWEI